MTNDASMTKKQSIVMFFSLIGLFIFLLVPVYGQQGRKTLTYDVRVRAVLIPIFAVDGDGNPVKDLKQEEIEFYVNGKRFDIAEFTAFTAENSPEEPAKPGTTESNGTLKAPARINFVVLDCLSNSTDGVKRGKEIAAGIVAKSQKDDAFVLLEAHPDFGIRYVTGPETDKKKLRTAIYDTMTMGNLTYWNKGYFMAKRTVQHLSGEGGMKRDDSSIEFRQRLFDMTMKRVYANVEEYKRKVGNFAFTLGQLKYVLKTVVQPKTVYLISGGVPKSLMGTDVTHYYKFLGEAAQSINRGGGMLFLVNPVRVMNSKMGESLKYMAAQSAGRYFNGASPELVVDKVKRNTSAYYELAFYPGDTPGDSMKIDVKCKRKGIQLNTINVAERGKLYSEMPELQRRLFALSVVMGGSWSRIVGRVSKAKIETVNVTNLDKRKIAAIKDVDVSIPGSLANRSVDVFIVNLEPVTMKAVISAKRLNVRDTLKLKVPVLKEKQQFVVLVEPEKTKCIYNKVL